MTSRQTYDVIITGAGPAGATAGYLLSRAGLKVLIIDKSRFPRKKLCAGLITWKTARLLERVFGKSPDTLREEGIINHVSHGYTVFGGKTRVTSRAMALPFLFVDRDSYDHYLLELARDAGARFVGGELVRSLDIARNFIAAQSGSKYYADFFIGADGVNSRTRRSFPLELFGRNDWKENLAFAHELFISRTKVSKQYDRPALFFGAVEKGYAWIFPNRERLKVGMCAINRQGRKEICRTFQSFLSSQGIDADDAEYASSYVLPFGNYLPEPAHKNLLLTGDAAGFADPLVGEGIYYAHRSAEFAADAILEFPADEKAVRDRYLENVREYILPELVYAGKISNAISRYFSRFSFIPLKIVMALLGNMPIETIQGMRSYQWMKKRH